MTIVIVRRTGALGDVVLTTPVIRHLRAELGPEATIVVETIHSDVFSHSPHKVESFLFGGDRPRGTTLIDLDLAYELRPKMHIVAAYSEVLEAAGFPPIPEDRRLQEMFPDQPMISFINPTVAVHAARSWENRTLPTTFWLDTVSRLRQSGYRVVFVGTDRDQLTGPFCNQPLNRTAALLTCCAAFLGSDSSLLHVAAAVGCPVVGLFTSVRPEYRMPLGGPGVALIPAGLSCWGCLERALVPTTNLKICERGDTACIWRFNPAEVVEAVSMVLRPTPAS